MPWTIADVERHKRGLTPAQKRRWVRVANDALRRCLERGGTDATCAPSAIRQANAVATHQGVSKHPLSVATANESYQYRVAQHQGREHWVVPVVMMVEGVHHGSHGPLLYTADELARFPAAWNGIPVMIGHPHDEEGRNVSANDPEVLDREVVGRVYNTRLNGDRLKAEAWVDAERLKALNTTAFDAIRNGRPLEVSVGVFTDEEETEGEWHGEQYSAVARNYRPDHLALLPDAEGACSWDDGCGIRNEHFEIQKKGGNMKLNGLIVINALSYSGTESTAWSGPTLADFGHGSSWEAMTAQQRADVAGHYLIGSGGAATFGELKFPVVNPHTGRLNERALRAVISGRGAQVGGVSAEVRAAARRRAYRLLNSEFGAGLEIPGSLEAQKLVIYDGNVLDLTDNQDVDFTELISSVQRKLDAMDNDLRVHFLEKIYDDYFVYRVVNKGDGAGEKFYKRDYTLKQDGTIEFGEDTTQVRKQVTFEEVQAMRRTRFNTKSNVKQLNKGGSKMNDKKKGTPCAVDALIQNKATQFTEEDREWLEGLEEDQLKKLAPVALETPPAENEGTDGDKKSDAGNANQDTAPVVDEKAIADKVKTILSDEKSLDALGEIGAQMKSGLRLYRQRREQLIKGIVENSKFEADQLKDWKDADLQALHDSIVTEPADYSLKGAYSGTGSDIDNEEAESMLYINGVGRDDGSGKK